MINDLDALLSSAVTEVFTTMLSYPVDPCAPDSHGNGTNPGESHVAGAVGFTGGLSGVVYISMTGTFAREITSRLLGITDAEIDGDAMVNDAIGEIANMVVGHVKSRISDRGLTCILTVPSVVRGNSFSFEPVGEETHHVLCFRSHDKPLKVEVMIKPSEQSQKFVTV